LSLGRFTTTNLQSLDFSFAGTLATMANPIVVAQPERLREIRSGAAQRDDRVAGQRPPQRLPDECLQVLCSVTEMPNGDLAANVRFRPGW
jgi:hypothetical protein